LFALIQFTKSQENIHRRQAVLLARLLAWRRKQACRWIRLNQAIAHGGLQNIVPIPPQMKPDFGFAVLAGADASFLETFSTHEFSFSFSRQEKACPFGKPG